MKFCVNYISLKVYFFIYLFFLYFYIHCYSYQASKNIFKFIYFSHTLEGHVCSFNTCMWFSISTKDKKNNENTAIFCLFSTSSSLFCCVFFNKKNDTLKKLNRNCDEKLRKLQLELLRKGILHKAVIYSL